MDKIFDDRICQVMLLGHQDGYTADKVMKTTVAFNHFGPQLVQRMPRYACVFLLGRVGSGRLGS